jgi:hypothetical protein
LLLEFEVSQPACGIAHVRRRLILSYEAELTPARIAGQLVERTVLDQFHRLPAMRTADVHLLRLISKTFAKRLQYSLGQGRDNPPRGRRANCSIRPECDPAPPPGRRDEQRPPRDLRLIELIIAWLLQDGNPPLPIDPLE